jgi:hypothetical protein
MGQLGMNAARAQRLRRAHAASGRDGADAVSLPSDSNDAWLIGAVVLRICYRGDRKRFEREAVVAAAMPASVRVPRLLEQGSDGEVAWQVSELVDGVPLGVAWPALAVADPPGGN